MNISKTQLSKIVQLEGFLSRILEPLLKTGLPLIENVLKPLSESVLVPLGLTAASLTADAAIHKKILGSGTTTLIFSNEDLNDIIKLVKSLEGPGLLIKGVSETVGNEVKNKKEIF